MTNSKQEMFLGTMALAFFFFFFFQMYRGIEVLFSIQGVNETTRDVFLQWFKYNYVNFSFDSYSLFLMTPTYCFSGNRVLEIFIRWLSLKKIWWSSIWFVVQNITTGQSFENLIDSDGTAYIYGMSSKIFTGRCSLKIEETARQMNRKMQYSAKIV